MQNSRPDPARIPGKPRLRPRPVQSANIIPPDRSSPGQPGPERPGTVFRDWAQI